MLLVQRVNIRTDQLRSKEFRVIQQQAQWEIMPPKKRAGVVDKEPSEEEDQKTQDEEDSTSDAER